MKTALRVSLLLRIHGNSLPFSSKVQGCSIITGNYEATSFLRFEKEKEEKGRVERGEGVASSYDGIYPRACSHRQDFLSMKKKPAMLFAVETYASPSPSFMVSAFQCCRMGELREGNGAKAKSDNRRNSKPLVARIRD